MSSKNKQSPGYRQQFWHNVHLGDIHLGNKSEFHFLQNMKYNFNKYFEEQYEDASLLKTAFEEIKLTLYWKGFSKLLFIYM